MPSKKKKWPSGTPRYWGTNDEIKYLEEIGKHNKTSLNKMKRAEWLKKYKESMKRRDRWETINPNEIMTYIDAEIAKCGQM